MLAAASTVLAHHSVLGEFDLSKSVTLTGTIAKVGLDQPASVRAPQRHGAESIRNVECGPQAEPPAPAFPRYRPEFEAKVADLRERQVQTDTILRCYPPAVLAERWIAPPRVLRRSDRELEEPPRCEERDLEHMVDQSQYHDNPW